jgi:excisionase family DNA binding protein
MDTASVEIAPAAQVRSPSMRTELPKNWVEIAVDMIGGTELAAQKLGVKRQTIYEWVRRGSVAHVRFETVVRFHRLSHVAYERLTGIDPMEDDG